MPLVLITASTALTATLSPAPLPLASSLEKTVVASTENDFRLSCQAQINYEKLFALEVTLSDQTSNQRWGEYQQFRFFLSRKGPVVELQLFDGAEPSRSYASADLEKSNFIELIIWKNELILNLKCSK